MNKIQTWWHNRKVNAAHKWRRHNVSWFDYCLHIFGVVMTMGVTAATVTVQPYGYLILFVTVPIIAVFIFQMYIWHQVKRNEPTKKVLDYLIHMKFTKLCIKYQLTQFIDIRIDGIPTATQIYFLQNMLSKSATLATMLRDEDMKKINQLLIRYWKLV